MEQCIEDLTDDVDNLSFTSTATTTTTTTTAKHSKSSEATNIISSEPISSNHSSKTYHAPPCDPCWRAIRRSTTLADLRFVQRLGSGDIGSVYLVDIKGGDGCLFACKVMNKNELATRNKETRAKVEREILKILDHPFLPSLYVTFDSPRWSCFLSEFCPGGDLHVLRQQLPHNRFNDAAVRFYASEVIVALEYLHMMGIIYRDLKPENILVKADGHIMLTDFDLSLKDDSLTSTAQIVSDKTQNRATHCHPNPDPPDHSSASSSSSSSSSSCILPLPNCIVPGGGTISCFHPIRRRRRRKSLEIIAEPIDIRSMSFVGTHEYLAPEIVSGDGHGNAVDWWTLGIFMFELYYGTTPFKGIDHELTLANVVARALEFPKEPLVPTSAKDLISRLLTKDPLRRLGSRMGASAIKHHEFFDGMNWALLRCTIPPYIPKHVTPRSTTNNNSIDYY